VIGLRIGARLESASNHKPSNVYNSWVKPSSARKPLKTPIRIAIVTNADWYFWSHRLALARALNQAGFEVLVIAAEERGYGEKIVGEGLRFLPLPVVRGSTRPFTEINTVKHLIGIYRRERPELVHHVAVKAVIYGSIAARVTGTPNVINAIAGQGYLSRAVGLKGMGLRSFARLAYKFAFAGNRTRGIFQNPDDLNAFVRSRVVSPDKAVLIRGSGVDLGTFAPAPEPMGVPRIVFASRLLWSKGLGELVEAKRLLDDQGIASRLLVFGLPDEHNPESVALSQIHAWEREGVLEWGGNRSDMASVLQDSHIVALPSYSEGLPKILLEAAAVGRPIVATDIPGCREIVRDQLNGLLVPCRDPAALAKALRVLLTSSSVRQRMGIAGREIAVMEFGESGVVAKTLEIYRELLGPHWP